MLYVNNDIEMSVTFPSIEDAPIEIFNEYLERADKNIV